MKKLGVVARFRPLHLAHAALLDALCAEAGEDGEVAIGIGSSNRYDGRNPFTAGEAADMIDAYLGRRDGAGARRVLEVPDLGNGPKWRVMVRERLGPLDLFVTANPYVRDLMTGIYAVAHPRDLVPRERHVAVSGELVRRAMARSGDAWRDLVPREVAVVLEGRGLPEQGEAPLRGLDRSGSRALRRPDTLIERFRREFGLSTLALEMNGAPPLAPTREEEERHVLLGR